MKSKDLTIYVLGGSRGGISFPNHAKIFIFTDLTLKTISSVTSD